MKITNLDKFVASKSIWQLFMMETVKRLFPKTVANILDGLIAYMRDEMIVIEKRKPGRPRKSV